MELLTYYSSLYYTSIPCDCGQYTRIFSRGALNCMGLLYIFRQYNTSMQFKGPRENVLVYLRQSH